ncbi:InlB B-repeat-containing protein [Desulfitobacterium hafniense]|uniref:InlB B-repeat-containing protein n=1 Tax=Desulfitobacterium hafniense TaxID=49338 RepID=UPI0003692103|nr:InlB B-repeat-containing protein [Desulfitobacterium hafniense]
MDTSLTKKTMTILLTLCLVLGMIPGLDVYVLAATNVPTGDYTISSNGDYQLNAGYSGKITIAETATAVRIIGNGAHTDTSIGVEGGRSSALELTIEDLNITAPVSGGNSGEHGIDFSNTGNYGHKLWLKGNCSITGDQAGIAVNDGVQLTIDKAADVANDADAVLTVLGKNGSAAIGGYYKNNHTDYGSCGEITINGGTINATGAAAYPNFVYGAAGIGGSLISVQGFTKGGTITINGGIITATGGEAAAGIGGGMGFNYNGASQGIITINGGTVVASGNKTGAGIGGGNTGGGYIININGGTITANGSADMAEGAGAGIGSSSFVFGSPTIVNISGGTITATGGTNSNFGGSGIGSGYLSEQGTINITGGSITAIGGSNGGAGIGGTSGNNGEKVTISGNPLVKAFAGTGAEDIGKGKGIGGSSGTLKNGTDDWVYLKFHVTKEGSNVAGATININSSQYTTDAGGYAYCFAPKSNTAYTIDAAGCQQASGTASNAKISNLVNVTMTAAVTYTVSFESNGGSAVPAIPNVVENSTVALPEPPTKAGYSFTGWYIDNDTFADEFTAGTFVTSNLTVYAKWTPLPPASYTVSFESNGGSPVATIPNVVENSTVALPTPPPTKAGYSFAGWYIDNDTFADEFTADTPVTSNLTVYAKWMPLPPATYTVSFESNGGSAVAAIPNVVENSTVALPTPPPTKAGYSFAGWYIDNDTFADEFTADTPVTSNLTVYAKWMPLPPATYTVSFESNGGSAVAAIPNVVENSTVALPTPPPTKAGYSFAGWYIDNDTFADEFTAGTFVTGNLTVYAKWATLPTDDSSDRDDSTSPSTPTPPSTPPATVTGNVKDGATGGTVSNVTATVAKDSHNQITLTLPAAQIAVTKQPDGTITPLLDLAKVVITKDTGTQLSISANGTFQIANLAQGTDHTFKIGYDLGNGQKITIGTMDITVDPSGSVKLDVTLIDPYGIITDGRTGKTLAGAKVILYYADTARNKAAGKTPGTLVELPPLEEFKPNQNINPQNSDPSGAYGFMVFPESDYYLVANKEGYEEYKSPTIAVEQDLVKWDFKMNQPLLGIKRLAGPTRVDTALEIAKATFTAKVKHVILATTANYPDALAGSVLAYKLNAPILLIDSSSEEQEKVLEYISMNLDSAGTVHILGGKGIVGSEIEEKIKARGFAKITRIGGKDRYETALKIAEYLEVPQGTPVVLVYGEDYPDALSISSSAAAMQSPILLVGRNEIRPEISQALQKIKPIKVYILGREGKISSAVEKQVAEAAGLGADKIVRIGGTDRYETALKIAQYFNLSGQNVSIATGKNFPDALAGSIYAANHNSPLLLCDEELSEEAAAYLRTRAITGGTLFGGEGAVSKAVEEMLKQIIGK